MSEYDKIYAKVSEYTGTTSVSGLKNAVDDSLMARLDHCRKNTEVLLKTIDNLAVKLKPVRMQMPEEDAPMAPLNGDTSPANFEVALLKQSIDLAIQRLDILYTEVML